MSEETNWIEIRRAPYLRYTTIKEAIEGGRPFLKYEEKLNLSLDEGTLVDLETNEAGEPITVGLVRGNGLNIFQLLDDDPATVSTALKSIAEGAEGPGLEEPLIAFNVSFERSIFEGKGISKRWLELQQPIPYVDEAGEWRRFEEACLKKEFYVYLPSIDFMPGKIIPRLWKLYLRSEDVWERARIVYDIMRHNRQCLLKELTILLMGETYEG